MARVKSYADVLREYEYHSEPKCADSIGKACRKQTVGLLGRRHVMMSGFTYIGKESNSLEEVEAEITSDAADVYTEYPDQRRDEWKNEILPRLRTFCVESIVRETGISRRTVQRIRKEHTKATPEHRRLLEEYVKKREIRS